MTMYVVKKYSNVFVSCAKNLLRCGFLVKYVNYKLKSNKNNNNNTSDPS